MMRFTRHREVTKMNIVNAMNNRYFGELKSLIGITDTEITYIRKHRKSKHTRHFLIALEQSFLHNNVFGYANLKIELSRLRNTIKIKEN